MNHNIKYKDAVFRDYFGLDKNSKERLISLYNAITGKNLPEDTETEPMNIGDVLFYGLRNDIATVIDGKVLVLMEHQSTINENMPLRCLEYSSRMYEMMFATDDRYKQGKLPIPTPAFYVFYIGKEDYPEEKILKLSDSFMIKEEEVSLELKVKVININKNKNHPLLKKCGYLGEYSQFVEICERHIKEEGKEEGFTNAIKECIKRGIMADYLREKAVEVESMLIAEYDYDTDIRVRTEEAREKGRKEGMEKGMEKGREEGEVNVIRKLMKIGIPIEKLAEVSGLTPEKIRSL